MKRIKSVRKCVKIGESHRKDEAGVLTYRLYRDGTSYSAVVCRKTDHRVRLSTLPHFTDSGLSAFLFFARMIRLCVDASHLHDVYEDEFC